MTDKEPGDKPRVVRRRARRPVVFVAVATALVVGAAALAGLWHVSASPQFCNSCHIMQPYVTAWKASRHNTIACVQCHYPPGFRDTLWVKFQAVSQVAKWATQTYNSKPYAVVEDASCLRSGCHSLGKLESRGVVSFGRGVKFDHRPHLDSGRMGSQLRCTSCHSQITVDTHFEVTTNTCFVCHFKAAKNGRELRPIAGCTGCHEPPKGVINIGALKFKHSDVVQRGVACVKCHLNVVEGEGAAPRARCFTCHNQPEKLQRYSDTKLLHADHVSARTIECTRCHTEIKHKLPPPIGAPTAAGPRGRAALALHGNR